jgi:hypothetical protein
VFGGGRNPVLDLGVLKPISQCDVNVIFPENCSLTYCSSGRTIKGGNLKFPIDRNNLNARAKRLF